MIASFQSAVLPTLVSAQSVGNLLDDIIFSEENKLFRGRCWVWKSKENKPNYSG
jgi:hypothetical protein